MGIGNTIDDTDIDNFQSWVQHLRALTAQLLTMIDGPSEDLRMVRQRLLYRWCCYAWAVVYIFLAPSPAWAIDPAVVEAARKEGRVVWHTSQIAGELALPLASAFKAAYGIDVSVIRSTPRQMAERVAQADRAGQGTIDVVDGRGAIAQMKRAGHLAAVTIDNSARLPRELVDPQGTWFATNVFTISLVVNTELVAPARRPRTLQDLLAPEWAGRMAWSLQSTLSGAPGFIGTVLMDKGETDGRSYLERLARQQIAGYDVSSREIIEKVIAGEAEIGLQIYSHQVGSPPERNAPIAWLPLDPVTASFSAVAVTRRAPHPNAARLFVEFQLSQKGQEIFRDAAQLPADPQIAPADPLLMPAGGKFRALYISPDDVEAKLPAWNAIRDSLFP